MRHSKRSLEGYYLVDNTASGGTKQEAPIVTCAHCQYQILLNAGRTRDRAECPRCDKYICDGCALVYKTTLECQNIQRQFDQRERKITRDLMRYGTIDPECS